MQHIVCHAFGAWQRAPLLHEYVKQCECFVLCRFCFERLEEQFNRNKVASPALFLERGWNQFSASEVTCLRSIMADYAGDVAADKK